MTKPIYLSYILIVLSIYLMIALLESSYSRRRNLKLYDWNNTRTSLLILFSCYAVNYHFQPLFMNYFSFFNGWVPWKIGPQRSDSFASFFSWSLVLLIVLDDFVYYVSHRLQHKIGFLWRIHATHHSSRLLNTLVAGRISPLEFSTLIYWPILVIIGFDPLLVLFVHTLNINYNIILHSELIGKLGPLEWFMMTPTHHRLHHSSQELYEGKNLGGIFIIWDKMFGTFVAEKPGFPKGNEQNCLTSVDSASKVIFYGVSYLPKQLAKIVSAREPKHL